MATENRENGQPSVTTLLRQVAAGSPEERERALAAVVADGFDVCRAILEAALRDDDDYNLRNGAMDVLVAFGPAAVPRLLELLTDANEEVRNFSAVMLGNIRDERAVTALIAALEDGEAIVRHAAAEALGQIGDSRALEPLRKMGEGDVWDLLISSEAILALAERGSKP